MGNSSIDSGLFSLAMLDYRRVSRFKPPCHGYVQASFLLQSQDHHVDGDHSSALASIGTIEGGAPVYDS